MDETTNIYLRDIQTEIERSNIQLSILIDQNKKIIKLLQELNKKIPF